MIFALYSDPDRILILPKFSDLVGIIKFQYSHNNDTVLFGVHICLWWQPEVVSVTFSNSDSALVTKFLNPGSAIFLIWEFDSCWDSGYSHRSNRNLPMLLLKKWPNRLLLLLRSEIPSGLCAKLRTVAASNNRVRMPWSLSEYANRYVQSFTS